MAAADVFCLFSVWMWSSVQDTLNVSGPLAQFGRPNLGAAHKLHIYCFLIGYSTAGAWHNVCITLIASESFPTKKTITRKNTNPKDLHRQHRLSRCGKVSLSYDAPPLIHTFPPHQQNRGIFLVVLELCPEWEQFLGYNAQKWTKISFGKGSKAAISFCWGNSAW